MTAIAEATQATASPAGGLRDRREYRRNGSRPGRRPPKCAVPVNGSRQDSARSASAAVRSLSMLLAELVELGREAWRISERERAVRVEIKALREIEDNTCVYDHDQPR